MSTPTRSAVSRLCLLRSVSRSPRRAFTSTRCAAKDEPWPQRTPLGPYYENILRDPTPYTPDKKPEEPPESSDPGAAKPESPAAPPQKKPASPAAPSEKKPASPAAPPGTKKRPGRRPKSSASSSSPTPSAPSSASPPPTTAAERARIVFGSRLLGPAEEADRLAARAAQSTYIAGVLVPPRPEEPDNCCMSGCVNCVWDRFREDMEEWSAKKTEAEVRLRQHSGSMDADGGGSDANWGVDLGRAKITKDLWNEDVFQSVPVGIREFMKQEKRLREKHQREGTLGG